MTRGAPHVLGPGGAVDEERGGVDAERHVGDAGLRQRQVAQRRTEEVPAVGADKRCLKRGAGKTERCGADGGAEDVERRHREAEAAAGLAKAVGERNAAVLEFQPGERVRGDHLEPLGDGEAGRVGVDDEGRETAGASALTRAGEDDVEVGDAAVGDPRLLAVDDHLVALDPGGGLDGRNVGA